MSQVSRPYAGIDIGVNTIHVCIDVSPHIPIAAIDLADPLWWKRLHNLIGIHAAPLVALEPTGSHYSAPVIAALEHIGAEIVIVNHATTGHIRELSISKVKNDTTDARSLAHIAASLSSGAEYRGVRRYHQDEMPSYALRLMVLAYGRAVKETTRATNRLHQLAHSIAPILSQRLEIYMRAIRVGAITADEVRELAIAIQEDGNPLPTEYRHKTARNNLISLASDIPPFADGMALRPAFEAEIATISRADEHKNSLKKRIDESIHADTFKDLTTLWETVPCSGVLTIAAIIGACKGKAAEMTVSEFRASVGSHPKTAQSGQTSETKAARQGFKPSRSAMYLWTLLLIRHGENPVAARYEAKKRAGDKQAVYIARATLANMLHGIARSGRPYDPNYATERTNSNRGK